MMLISGAYLAACPRPHLKRLRQSCCLLEVSVSGVFLTGIPGLNGRFQEVR